MALRREDPIAAAAQSGTQPAGRSRRMHLAALSSRRAMNFEWRKWLASVQSADSICVVERELPECTRAMGGPWIALEKLLRALLLQVLYTVRSERMLMEQLDYNFLFRWLVGLSIDDPVWDVTVFTKNRERLLKGEVAQGFFHAVVEQARAQGLLSDEHFTVDGTLIEAWAATQELQAQGADDRQTPPDDLGNPSVDFHGERRPTPLTNRPPILRHGWTGRGAGKEAKLSYAGHVEMDNRHGTGGQHPTDSGQAGPSRARPWRWWKRSRALAESRWAPTRATIKRSSCGSCASIEVTPHIAQRQTARSTGRTSRPGGYLLSQTAAQTGRGDLRLAQDRGRCCARLVIVESLRVRLDLHLCCYRLQPGQDAQPAACTGLEQLAW